MNEHHGLQQQGCRGGHATRGHGVRLHGSPPEPGDYNAPCGGSRGRGAEEGSRGWGGASSHHVDEFVAFDFE